MMDGTSSSASPEARTAAAMDKTAFRQWNEAMVKKYNLELFYARAGLLVSLVERCRMKRILELLQPQEVDWVLDVGCGAGHLTVGDCRLRRTQPAPDRLSTSDSGIGLRRHCYLRRRGLGPLLEERVGPRLRGHLGPSSLPDCQVVRRPGVGSRRW